MFRIKDGYMGHEIMKPVYMITYPTGKIYIGKDSYGNPRYFGSPDPDIINNDFAILPETSKPNPLNGWGFMLVG